MPTTNGHPVQTGCFAEGHRGWYAGQRVIEVAQSLGWELDAEGQQAVDDFYSQDDHDDLHEIVIGQGGIVDDAEAWLNEHTPVLCAICGGEMEWRDGLYRAVHVATDHAYCERGIYTDPDEPHGTINGAPMGRPQSYVWHWRDGEFFLSRICEDHDSNCTDDECAGWD